MFFWGFFKDLVASCGLYFLVHIFLQGYIAGCIYNTQQPDHYLSDMMQPSIRAALTKGSHTEPERGFEPGSAGYNATALPFELSSIDCIKHIIV